jgi:hypothetical protein
VAQDCETLGPASWDIDMTRGRVILAHRPYRTLGWRLPCWVEYADDLTYEFDTTVGFMGQDPTSNFREPEYVES